MDLKNDPIRNIVKDFMNLNIHNIHNIQSSNKNIQSSNKNIQSNENEPKEKESNENEPKESSEIIAKDTLECLVLNLKRSTLQGGISNEKYPIKNLYDARLTHHIPTLYVEEWKGFTCAGPDSKFTDLEYVNNKDCKAEGKNIKKGKGVNLKPSIDTGGGREFILANLEECFNKNDFYFLYETVSHTEELLIIHVYWVPINLIKKWYSQHGVKGVIKYQSLKNCINDCELIIINK